MHLCKGWRLLLLQGCIVRLRLHMRLHGRLLRQGRLNRRHWRLSVLLHGRGLRLLLLRGSYVAICQCCGWFWSIPCTAKQQIYVAASEMHHSKARCSDCQCVWDIFYMSHRQLHFGRADRK